MNTKRLYMNDSYITECDAVVLDCRPKDDGFDVVLDQTVLFPTSGGQPHDTGTIGDAAVTDVREEGETIFHHTDAAFSVGDTVHVVLDWPRRFDHMQQHSGEHMLSFAAHELYNAVNVGFHMAQTYSTIDIDIPLTREQADEMERRTNALLQKNLPVELRYVTAEELEHIKLRKKAAGLAGDIRIVSMPGGDSCTCCATHVAHTGEVGLCKITSVEHYKGGSRLTFACGSRALTHAQTQQNIVDKLAKSLSCKAENVPEAIEALKQDAQSSHRENKALLHKLNRYMAAELLAEAKTVNKARLIVRCFDDITPAQMKNLAQTLCKEPMMLLLLATEANGSLQYMLCCSEGVKLDMGELCQAVNAATGGNGGGRGTLAQGSAPASSWRQDTFTQLEAYLLQRLERG